MGKQVPWGHRELSAADELLLRCWEGQNETLKGNLPFAVDVIPDELDAHALLQKALDQQISGGIPLPSVAVHHADDLSVATKGCS